MFALVDANNAYVSFERCFRPELRGRPIVVLSSNDGACIARSDEAKALGVGMAQPWFEVRHLARSAGLVALSANMELYGEMSSRLMSVISRFAPVAVPYSIDECFLEFEGVSGDLVSIGRALRETVLREIGVPTSVGFGPTKTLAKLANHIAKSAARKPGSYPTALSHVCHLGLMSATELDGTFGATDIGEVWGIGRRISARLKAGGVRTVRQFVRSDPASIRRNYSVVLEKTLLELRGIPCMTLDEAPAPRKQIMVSRSFGTAVTTLDGIIEAVSEFASRGAEKLRQQGSVADAVTLFFTTSPFRTKDAQHSPSVTIALSQATSDTRVIVGASVAAVRRLYRPGYRYAKAGVMMVNLRPAGSEQVPLDLFSQAESTSTDPNESRGGRLMQAMDLLNQRFGRDAVKLGSQAVASGSEGGHVWAGKQDRRTPRYTTRWDEILRVRC